MQGLHLSILKLWMSHPRYLPDQGSCIPPTNRETNTITNKLVILFYCLLMESFDKTICLSIDLYAQHHILQNVRVSQHVYNSGGRSE